MDSRGLTVVPENVIPELKSTIDTLSKNNVDLAQRNEDLENTMRILSTVPPQPQESPAKKTFKVVGSLGGETEV